MLVKRFIMVAVVTSLVSVALPSADGLSSAGGGPDAVLTALPPSHGKYHAPHPLMLITSVEGWGGLEHRRVHGGVSAPGILVITIRGERPTQMGSTYG